jgi:hypothetical protein
MNVPATACTASATPAEHDTTLVGPRELRRQRAKRPLCEQATSDNHACARMRRHVRDYFLNTLAEVEAGIEQTRQMLQTA